MTAGPLSAQVCWLLREHLTTFEQLEVLLYLRNHRDGEFDAAALGETLALRSEHLIEALKGLAASELITAGPDGNSFRFAPRSPELTDAVEGLAVAYQEHSAPILSTMSIYAIERIRSGPLRAFADSFVVGGKKRDG